MRGLETVAAGSPGSPLMCSQLTLRMSQAEPWMHVLCCHRQPCTESLVLDESCPPSPQQGEGHLCLATQEKPQWFMALYFLT